MRIEIPVKNERDLFIKHLLFLNPILKLREETEIPVLASFLVLYKKYKDYKQETLYELLFSDQTKGFIRESLNMAPKAYNHAMKKLVEKGMLESEKGRINPRLLYPIIKGDYEIQIIFKKHR